MREIKFRAWDKIRKTMTPSFDFRQWEGNKLYRPDNGVAMYGDLELMQFTGLKDKNGKEIYEGDIIKIGESNFKVILDNIIAQFILDTKHFHLGTQSIFYEIIGNKFENKDLIK